MKAQFEPLVRHFFGRFFDNEFVSQNSDMQVAVTKLLALLASPGLLLPLFRYTTYIRIDGQPEAARLAVLWFDRCFLMSFAILVMGGVTVLEWDALFPDRRDYASLIPLPIRARTMFLAKVSALILFLLGFTAAVSFASTILFPVISYRYHGYPYADPFVRSLVGFVAMAGTMAAQGISVLAASAFVFLSLVALEGILLNVLSERWFRRTSVYVQCGMVFALLSLFFLFPNIAGQIPELKARNAAVLYAFPPVWFLGLNEALLGSKDWVFVALARRAEMALGLAAALSAAAYAVAYRRHVQRTLESMEGGEGNRTWVHERVGRVADWLAPSPMGRATVAFIGKTMARSAKHRIFLAAYAGVGCAFVLQGLLASGMRQAWLSAPLVLGFFVLSGMRYIFTIPAELPANWVFRLSETEERGRAIEGTRTAMIWFGVGPLFTALAPLYFVLWTPGVALAHLAFSVTLSVLLVEALLFEFWKIPFTCSYPPGKANVTLLWVFYWVGFTTYAYLMATLEAWMAPRPARLVWFYAIAGALWGWFQWQRRRWDQVGFTLVFEDAADPAVRTLGLSESAWTRKAPPRQPLVRKM